MAGKKRKAAPVSQASPKQTSSSTRPSQRVRPSVELVEISSDEHEEPLPGAARGLNEGNILPPPAESVEQADDFDNEDTVERNHVARRMTRGSRNGRTDDRINYDMKYHPMDEITRPKWAAQRHSGPRSLSATAFKAGDGDTSDASLPSSAKESDDETSGNESAIEELPARIPDPHASRRSTRAEAIKSVNYSRKHHPQDHGIPGHQHKAQLKRLEKRKQTSSKRTSPKVQIPPRDEDAEDKVVAYDSDDEEDLEQEGSSGPKPAARPRKKLRVLDDGRSSSLRKSKKKGRRPAKSTQSSSRDRRPDPLPETYSEEDAAGYIDDVMDVAGDEAASASDAVEAAQNLNGLVDDAQASSSSARNISSVLAAKQNRPIGGVNTFASDTEEDPQDFVDQTQSQYPTQQQDIDSRSVDHDDNAARVGDSDRLSEDEEDDFFTNARGKELESFESRSLASIAAGPSRNRNSLSGKTRSPGEEDLPVRSDALHASGDEGAMGPPRSSAEPLRPHKNGISNRIAALVRTRDRMESSTSTFKASTRAEPSSSTFKASSRVSSRTAPPRSELNPVNAVDNTGEGDAQSDSTPRARSEIQQDQALATSTNGMKAAYGHLTGSQSLTEVATMTEARYVHLPQSRAPQPISPVASFKEGNLSKPMTPEIPGQQHRIEPCDLSGEDRRSQIARESSRISLQSPDPTPLRTGNASTPSLSQQSHGGTLLYSHPDHEPMENGERSEDEDSPDSILPFLSTDSSSPSKFVDVI